MSAKVYSLTLVMLLNKIIRKGSKDNNRETVMMWLVCIKRLCDCTWRKELHKIDRNPSDPILEVSFWPLLSCTLSVFRSSAKLLRDVDTVRQKTKQTDLWLSNNRDQWLKPKIKYWRGVWRHVMYFKGIWYFLCLLELLWLLFFFVSFCAIQASQIFHGGNSNFTLRCFPFPFWGTTEKTKSLLQAKQLKKLQ